MYYELLDFINQYGYQPNPDRDNTDKLLKGVLDGVVGSDGEGRKLLGDCSAQYYYRIKDQAYMRLIHFHFQYKEVSSTLPNIHAGIYKELAIVKDLANLNKRQLASYLLDKLIKKAKKYYVSEVVLALIRLKLQYNAVYGAPTNRRKFHRKLAVERDYFVQVLQIESKLEELYAEFALIFLDRVEIAPYEFELVNDIEEQVLALNPKIRSYRIDYFRYYLLCGIQDAKNEVEGLIDCCEQAIKVMSNYNLKHIPYVSLSSFYFRLIAVLIKQNQFEEAAKCIIKAENIVPKKTRNRFLLDVLKTTLFLHGKRFQEAAEVLKKINNVDSFSKVDQESYTLYKAFANIFTGQKVRLGKLLNEVPIFATHKRGQNILILTIQILVNVQRKEYGNVADKVEALKRYSVRHLRNNQNFRSYLWITICIRLVQSKFNKLAFIRKAEKEVEILKKNPIGKYNKEVGSEIVRFEDCYKFLLRYL